MCSVSCDFVDVEQVSPDEGGLWWGAVLQQEVQVSVYIVGEIKFWVKCDTIGSISQILRVRDVIEYSTSNVMDLCTGASR